MEPRPQPSPAGANADASPAPRAVDSRVLSVLELVIDEPPDLLDNLLRLHCSGNAELEAQVRRLMGLRPAGFLSTSPLDHLTSFGGPTLAPGAAVGGYRVVGPIGRGGMAEVYEALQVSTGQRVALKLLRPDIPAHLARRFSREISTLSRLRHPGIVRVLDAGSAVLHGRDCPFLIMELVQGESLLNHARALDTGRRLELLAQAADVVQAAHLAGVIHRDLKPANILVDTSGFVRIIDFGVSTALDPAMRPTLGNTLGSVVGTLLYMSPEQLEADPTRIDARTDIFSFGVTLWEVVTGQVPWGDVGSTPEMIDIIRHGPTPRLSAEFSRSYSGLAELLSRCVHKDPALRYQSAGAVAADLRRILAGEPVEGVKPTLKQLARSAWKRHRLLVTASVSIGAVLILATAVTTSLAVRAQRAERLAQNTSRDLLALVSSLSFKLFNDLLEVPGSAKAMESAVRQSIEALEKAEPQVREDPRAVALLADAYGKAGSICGSPSMRSLRNLDLARPMLDRHVALVQHSLDLTREASGDLAGGRLSLAIAFSRRASVAIDFDERRRWLDQTLEATRSAESTGPLPADARVFYCNLLLNVGEFRISAGLGNDLVLEAIRECEPLIDLLPASVIAPEVALAAHLIAGWDALRSGDTAQAQHHAAAARSHATTASSRGGMIDSSRRYPIHISVLETLSRPSACDDAEALRTALSEHRSLLLSDPENLILRQALADLLLTVAEQSLRAASPVFSGVELLAMVDEATALEPVETWQGGVPWIVQQILDRATRVRAALTRSSTNSN